MYQVIVEEREKREVVPITFRIRLSEELMMTPELKKRAEAFLETCPEYNDPEFVLGLSRKGRLTIRREDNHRGSPLLVDSIAVNENAADAMEQLGMALEESRLRLPWRELLGEIRVKRTAAGGQVAISFGLAQQEEGIELPEIVVKAGTHLSATELEQIREQVTQVEVKLSAGRLEEVRDRNEQELERLCADLQWKENTWEKERGGLSLLLSDEDYRNLSLLACPERPLITGVSQEGSQIQFTLPQEQTEVCGFWEKQVKWKKLRRAISHYQKIRPWAEFCSEIAEETYGCQVQAALQEKTGLLEVKLSCSVASQALVLSSPGKVNLAAIRTALRWQNREQEKYEKTREQLLQRVPEGVSCKITPQKGSMRVTLRMRTSSHVLDLDYHQPCLAKFRKATREFVQEVQTLWQERENELREAGVWGQAASVALCRMVDANSRYITPSVAIKSLRGLSLPADVQLQKTGDEGKYNFIPSRVFDQIVSRLVDLDVLETRTLEGWYGYFDVLKPTEISDALIASAECSLEKNPMRMTEFELARYVRQTDPLDIRPDRLADLAELLLDHPGVYVLAPDEYLSFFARMPAQLGIYLKMVYAQEKDRDKRKLMRLVLDAQKKAVAESSARKSG